MSRPDHARLDRVGRIIDSRLGHEIDRIRRRFFLHGSGWIVAALFGIGLCYFLLDRTLHLPGPVRVLLSLAFVGYLVAGLRGRIIYPLTRKFSRADVAVVVERNFPDLQQSLISAVELKESLRASETDPAALRGQSAAMIEKVVDDAARDLDRVPIADILDPVRTLRVWGAAAAFVTVAGLATSLNPTTASVFLQRALGLSAPYPRLTRLVVELPPAGEDYRIVREGDRATVTVAAGADLPILVRANGVLPREVFLVVDGARGMPSEISMSKRPGQRFRHMFRRVRNEFSFHARGGDDPDGDLTVQVRTIHPPLVGTIRNELDFPDYTLLADEQREGGSIEALVGTRVRTVVTTTAPVAEAVLHFLDSDREISLTPTQLQDDSGLGHAFEGRFVVTETDRYQIDLLSPQGLRNPHPGTYPLIAEKDHAPVGKLLQPSGDDILVVVPDAVIPVRIASRDDYGLTGISVRTVSGRTGDEQPFELFEPPSANEPTRAQVVTELLDLNGFAGGNPAVGDTLSLTTTITDNCEPNANVTELAARQVHIVDRADLARRIAGQFRRLREDVEKAVDLQIDRHAMLEELVEELSGLAADSSRRNRMVTVEVGQGRVLTASMRIRTELMRAFDRHLFNRLEESIHAPKVLELYLQYHRNTDADGANLPGFYRMLAKERREGTLGALERTLDPILTMTMQADRLAEDLCPRAVRDLEAAGVESSEANIRTLLESAGAVQQEIRRELDGLLKRLAEWNEFQDVIQQARALRDQQRDVESRTRNSKDRANERPPSKKK